jgi:molybdopterin-guanine dinucleotide biosynthesis protein A
MGRDKAWLPFGERTLLEHVVERLAAVATPLVVVAAPEQALPPLPPAVRVVRDLREHEGPLVALALGLAALEARVDYAYVSATDVALVSPPLVRRLALLAHGHDAAVPVTEGRRHPLHAVYATHLQVAAERLVAAGERRLLALAEHADTRFVAASELLADAEIARTDPELVAFATVNTPEEYQSLLERMIRGARR